MNENKDAINNELDFDFDEWEKKLEDDIENELSNLELLKEDKEKIGNPDSLGKVVLDEVWKQFGNQIGLDITNETLIQQYDREHPENYEEVGKKVMQNDYVVTDSAKIKIEKIMKESVEDKDEHFANGRFARNLYDELIIKHARRVSKINMPSRVDLMEIKEDDVSAE